MLSAKLHATRMAINAPQDLNGKQRRVLDRCLRELFGKNTFDDVQVMKSLKFPEVIQRLVSVSETRGFKLLLSAQAAAAHDRIVSTMQEIGLGDGNALYSDIWSAVRRVVERCFARSERPEDSDELVGMVRDELEKEVDDRLFLAPMLGVEFEGVEEVQLGSMTIASSVDAFINGRGLTRPSLNPAWLWKTLRGSSCIAGTYRGTFEAAKRKFTEQAHLLSGFLAVVAGHAFDRGATGFDIRVLIGSSESSGTSGYLFWGKGEKDVGWGGNGSGSQALKIDGEWASKLVEAGFMNYGFRLLQREPQTDVEEAIARAVYWYGDAHRDPVPVMQFIKYWSCIECFFSLDEKDVTEALALGVSVVLTFGHYQLLSRSDYAKNRAMVKNMYSKRSRAVHGAVHSHVNAQDLIAISQWAAFVIVNMVSFADAALPSRRVLLARLRHIDSKELAGT
jgi:hypothetical protein